MFYLETKDGDKFFTDPKSDDKVEFWRILDQKLGRQAATMFDEFIEDAKQEVYNEVDNSEILAAADDLNDVVSVLDNIISADNMKKSDIAVYINELRRISNKLRRLT